MFLKHIFQSRACDAAPKIDIKILSLDSMCINLTQEVCDNLYNTKVNIF